MYIPFEKNLAKSLYLIFPAIKRQQEAGCTPLVNSNYLIKTVLSSERFSLPQSTRCNIRVCRCWAGKEL